LSAAWLQRRGRATPLFHTLCPGGYNPVKRLARLGMHAGFDDTWRAKTVPLPAKRSMFGVRTTGLPLHPRQSWRNWSA
jgi:hypothetical protein